MDESEKLIKNSRRGSFLLIVIVIVAAILAVAALFYFKQGGGFTNPFAKVNPCEKVLNNNPAIVTIIPSGITPSAVMICPGQEVKWVNNSSTVQKFNVTSKGEDSARLREIEPIEPGETVSMSFSKLETIKYSLSQDFKGEIIVGKTEESTH